MIAALRLGKVDLYGDSYGTFFSQVFAGRHPTMVRSIVLDGAYPTYGEGALYPTQGPAMRRSFDVVCRRWAGCRDGGPSFLTSLERVLSLAARLPVAGCRVRRRRSPDAGHGRRTRTRHFGLRCDLRPGLVPRDRCRAEGGAGPGDYAPLLRLVAEATGGGTDAGAPRDYSEGLDAAVACHDYPQLYDMTAPPGAPRESQYADALTAAEPGPYGPFTVHEYAASDWQAVVHGAPAGRSPRRTTRPDRLDLPPVATQQCRCSCSAASWESR